MTKANEDLIPIVDWLEIKPYAAVLFRDKMSRVFKEPIIMDGNGSIEPSDSKMVKPTAPLGSPANPIGRNQLAMRCSNCFGYAKDRCTNCKVVHYCSVTCQKEDWPNHQVECEAFMYATYDENNVKRLNYTYARLIARVIAKHRRESEDLETQGSVENSGMSKKTQYRIRETNFLLEDVKIDELKSQRARYDKGEDFEASLEFNLAKSAFFDIYRYFPVAKSLSDDFFLMTFLRVFRNAFVIVDYTLDSGTIPIGLGLYLCATKFSQSCVPDVVSYFSGSNLKLKPVNWPKVNKVDKISHLSMDHRYLQELHGVPRPVDFQKRRSEFAKCRLGLDDCDCVACFNSEREWIMRDSIVDKCMDARCDDGEDSVMVVQQMRNELNCLNCFTVIKDPARARAVVKPIRDLSKLCEDASFMTFNEELVVRMRQLVLDAELYAHPTANVHLLHAYEFLFFWYKDVVKHWMRQLKPEDLSFEDLDRNKSSYTELVPFEKGLESALQYGVKLLAAYKYYLSVEIHLELAVLYYRLAELNRLLKTKEGYIQTALFYKRSAQAWARRFDKDHKCIEAIKERLRSLNKEIGLS